VNVLGAILHAALVGALFLAAYLGTLQLLHVWLG